MLPNVLLPNQQYNLCLEKKQVFDGVYEVEEHHPSPFDVSLSFEANEKYT